MYIVHIASECAPFAKVGGLGDVIHGLAKATVKLQHQVEIILPKYDCIDYDVLENLKVEYRELWSFDGPSRVNNTIWACQADGLRVLLIEPHHLGYFFSRGSIYGAADDIDRFNYFSRTALEYLYKSGKRPEVIHIHDWPTAIIAPLYKDMYIPLGMENQEILLTIHNIDYQGKCAVPHLDKVGLKGEEYLDPEKMQDLRLPDTINLLKGGIVYSDAVTTVSPRYEQEILISPGGCGLEEVLLENQDKMKGILNGIDETYWNPEKDPHLITRYNTFTPIDAQKMQKILQAKAENKKHLRTHLGLKDSSVPIVASITRLVPQKGPELIKHALLKTLEKGAQFVLLGSSATPVWEKIFFALKKEYESNKNVSIVLDRDEALAHLLYAAADMFIIPSIFEPCGLTQMIALRYGTVPIVRETGGLADTVFDIDTSKEIENKRNGFTFKFPDSQGIEWALFRALACYTQNQDRWQQIMMNGMSMDLSWNQSAKEYVSTYRQFLG